MDDRPETAGTGRRRVQPLIQALPSRLLLRVKNILLYPGTEWTVIAAERSSPRALYVGYVAPLVGVAAIATFLGETLVGIQAAGPGAIRLSAATAFGHAVLGFAQSFVAVSLVMLIVDALAPRFGGRRDRLAALKITAYSYTPAWVASILNLIPSLGILVTIAAFYGLYLVYLGLPVLMGSSKDQAVGYTVITVLCAMTIMIITGSLGSLAAGG